MRSLSFIAFLCALACSDAAHEIAPPITATEASAVKSAVELAGHDLNCFELSRELWRPFAQKELGDLSVDIATVRLEPNRERCPEAYPLRFVSPEFGIVWADELGRSSLQQEIVQSVRDSRRHSLSPSDRSSGRYPLLIVEEAEQWRVESYRPKHRGEAQQEDVPFPIHRRDSALVNKEQFFFAVEPGSSVLLDALELLVGFPESRQQIEDAARVLRRAARESPELCLELARQTHMRSNFRYEFTSLFTDASHPCAQNLVQIIKILGRDPRRYGRESLSSAEELFPVSLYTFLTREQLVGNPGLVNETCERGTKIQLVGLARALKRHELTRFVSLPVCAVMEREWSRAEEYSWEGHLNDWWELYFGWVLMEWATPENDAITRPALRKVYDSMRQIILNEASEVVPMSDDVVTFCRIQEHLGIRKAHRLLSTNCAEVE